MTTFIQTSHGSYITQQQPTSPGNLVNGIQPTSPSINPPNVYTSSSNTSLTSLTSVPSSSSSSAGHHSPVSASFSLSHSHHQQQQPQHTQQSHQQLSQSQSQHQQTQQQQQSSSYPNTTALPSSCSLSSTAYAVPTSIPISPSSSLSCLTSSSPSSHHTSSVGVTGGSSLTSSSIETSSTTAPTSNSNSSLGSQLIPTQTFPPGTTVLSSQGGSLVISPRNVSGLPSYPSSNQSTTIMLPLQGNGATSNNGTTVNEQLIGNQIISTIQQTPQIGPMVPLLLANGQFISTGIPSQGAFALSQANSSTTTTTSTSNQQNNQQQQYQFGNLIGTSLTSSNQSTQFVTNGSGQIFAISPSLINNLNQQQSSAAAINSLQSHQSTTPFIQVVTQNGIALVPANQIISEQPLMSSINNNNQMDNNSSHGQQLLAQQHRQSHHNASERETKPKRGKNNNNNSNFYSRNDDQPAPRTPSHSRMLKKSALAQAQLQQLQLQQQQQMNQAIQVSISGSSTSTSSSSKASGRGNNSSHGFPLGPSSLASLSCYSRSADLKALAMANSGGQQNLFSGNVSNSVESQSPSPPLSTASSMDRDSANQATVAQSINSGEISVVDGVNLEEVKEFARQFKLRRLSLGLTQTQVGQALSATAGPSYSQSAICRFEKLDITPKSASKIKPVLEKWMHDLEIRCRQGNTDPASFTGNPNSKKRKRRTSFSPAALEVLNAFFEKNTHPSSSEMTELADRLKYDREVVRVWFCNKRQVLRNNVKKSEPPLSLLTLTSRAAKTKSNATTTTLTLTATPTSGSPSKSNNNSTNDNSTNENSTNNNHVL